MKRAHNRTLGRGTPPRLPRGRPSRGNGQLTGQVSCVRESIEERTVARVRCGRFLDGLAASHNGNAQRTVGRTLCRPCSWRQIRDCDSPPVKAYFADGAVLRVCEVFRFLLKHQSLRVTLVLLLLVRAGSVITRRVLLHGRDEAGAISIVTVEVSIACAA
jgi:hypothetical protein